MEKRILLVIDGTHFSESVLDYGVYIAHQSSSVLEGVFMRDLRNTEYVYPILFDQSYVDTSVYTELMDIERQKINESIAKFKERCERENIVYKIHFDEQRPIDSVISRSAYADLIIIDGGTNISDIFPDTPSSSLREILIDALCPTLIVPAQARPIEDIVLACDGSYSSICAIKMFSYLFPEWRGLKTKVVSIEHTGSPKKVSDDADIADMLKQKFDDVAYHIEYGHIAEHLKNYVIKQERNSLVVMGAYGRNAISRLWRQSMANGLLREAQVPVFISHS